MLVSSFLTGEDGNCDREMVVLSCTLRRLSDARGSVLEYEADVLQARAMVEDFGTQLWQFSGNIQIDANFQRIGTLDVTDSTESESPDSHLW